MSLPSGYKRLEYIQSSGTQYIDTGLSAPTGMRVQCDVELMSLRSGLNMLFGSHDASDPYYRNYLAASSNGYWEIGAYGVGTFGSVTTGRKYNIDVCTISGSLSAKIDGTAYAIGNIAPSTKRSDLNVYLFALNYAGGLLWSSMKLYSTKIYLDAAGSSPARDFIPCKNASGTIGLWDDVNGLFYTNAGTGVFTAGPEVAGTHKTLINGTAYDVKSGKCLINGTGYAVKKGRALIDGTGYDVSFPKKTFHITYSINEGYYNVNRIIYNGEYLKGNGELYLEDGESIDLYVERASGYQGEVNLWVNLNGTRVASYSTDSSITYRFTPTSNCNIIGSNGNYVNTAVWDITTQ